MSSILEPFHRSPREEKTEDMKQPDDLHNNKKSLQDEPSAATPTSGITAENPSKAPAQGYKKGAQNPLGLTPAADAVE
jgi:hypothetical protein